MIPAETGDGSNEGTRGQKVGDVSRGNVTFDPTNVHQHVITRVTMPARRSFVKSDVSCRLPSWRAVCRAHNSRPEEFCWEIHGIIANRVVPSVG